MNLLFSINRGFVPLLKTCLRSIVRSGGAHRYDAYILHSDLTDEVQQEIAALFPGRVTFRFIHVDEGLFDGFPEFKRYPRQIYYRLAAPSLLPTELDRILYLDVDTVVINPLEELYHSDFEGAWFMACTNIKRILTKVNQVRLGVRDTPYINSGVMLLNLTALRAHFSLEDVRRYAMARKELLILPDQDIMTALCGAHVKLIDNLRYNLSDRTLSLHNADPMRESIDLQWVKDNTVIIHYFGRNKPWKENYRGLLGAFYHQVKDA